MQKLPNEAKEEYLRRATLMSAKLADKVVSRWKTSPAQNVQ